MSGTVTAPSAPESAAPQRPPRRSGAVSAAGAAWRQLRRMSTALALLLAVAVVAVVATFVPQEPAARAAVAAWRAGSDGPGASTARVLDALGLFDVFGAWWFHVLTGLLLVSLAACLVPRWRAFATAYRRPPPPGRDLSRLRHVAVLDSPREPEAALVAAGRLLRRRAYRVRRYPAAAGAGDGGHDGHEAGGRLAAERGHWREGASLLFHSAILLLLGGVAYSHAFGFTGQVDLVEGQRFVDTRLAYDRAAPGRAFGTGDHRGVAVRLDDFAASYHPNGIAEDFVAEVSVTGGAPGSVTRRRQVRINAPLRQDGMRLYLARSGLAPEVVVRDAADGRVLFDGPVRLHEAGQDAWSGVAVVSAGDAAGGQVAAELVLLPDAGRARPGPTVVGRSPQATAPLLLAEVYVGELGLDRARPAREFDRGGGPVGPTAVLGHGERAVTGGYVVEFTGLAEWAGFQVSHEPGRGLLLAGAALLLVGLVGSLHLSRRRLWVQARPGPGGGSRLLVAGVARQRREAFADEFAAFVGALGRRV